MGMEKVIENFIAYMREAKKASQNTEISYERDLKKLARYLRNQKIIALTPDDYPSFVEELKDSLTLFATDETQKKKWKLLYQPLIHPSTIFAFSISSLMLEFHPDYKKY